MCGVGPVEAAAATARALAEERPTAVLHVGIAGARGLDPPQLVVGSEAFYDDLAVQLAPRRASRTPGCSQAAAGPPGGSRAADRHERPVGGTHGLDVEAMEGFAVLRACELAGVPAVEVRAISNEIEEADRARWRFDEALAALAEALPRLVAVAVRRVSSRAAAAAAAARADGRPARRRVAAPVRQRSFRRALPLGCRWRSTDQLRSTSTLGQAVVLARALAVWLRPSRLRAAIAATSARAGRDWARALVAGTLVFAAGGRLLPWFVLASVAWLALVGLVVPVRARRPRHRRRVRRALELGRADYVHAVGSLATLVILFWLDASRSRSCSASQADNTCGPLFLADLVVAPLLFLGAALLYFDQAARGRLALPTTSEEEEAAMPTYLMLSTLTEKGVQTLKSNPARLREVNRDVEELGARVLHQWASLGEYDFVNIVEAPDDATIARVSIELGARGSAKLETLPLLDVETLLGSLEYGSPVARGRRQRALRQARAAARRCCTRAARRRSACRDGRARRAAGSGRGPARARTGRRRRSRSRRLAPVVEVEQPLHAAEARRLEFRQRGGNGSASASRDRVDGASQVSRSPCGSSTGRVSSSTHASSIHAFGNALGDAAVELRVGVEVDPSPR